MAKERVPTRMHTVLKHLILEPCRENVCQDNKNEVKSNYRITISRTGGLFRRHRSCTDAASITNIKNIAHNKNLFCHICRPKESIL